jgi:hypothetical protein
MNYYEKSGRSLSVGLMKILGGAVTAAATIETTEHGQPFQATMLAASFMIGLHGAVQAVYATTEDKPSEQEMSHGE